MVQPQPLLPLVSKHLVVHRHACQHSLRPISRDAEVQGRESSQEVLESEVNAAGRARVGVAQQLEELDCKPLRYKHRRHPLDTAVCQIDRKLDSPCLAGFDKWK